MQDLLQEPEQHDINIKYKETLAEKIEFAENFPHLLLPAELERLQQLKSTLTPQELEQLRKVKSSSFCQISCFNTLSITS